MELDPTVIPISAEIWSQDGQLLGRASEVHIRYLVLREADGAEREIPVAAIQAIEGKRVVVDVTLFDPV